MAAAAAAAVVFPLQWSPARWGQLVLASAESVLETKEKRRRHYDKITNNAKDGLPPVHAVIGPGLDLQQARRGREAALAEVAGCVRNVRARMAGSSAALALIDAACSGCQAVREDQRKAGAYCAITQSVERLVGVAVYGNRLGESRHVVREDLLDFVQVLMQVGNLGEWLDQRVDAELTSFRSIESASQLDWLVGQLRESIEAFSASAVRLFCYVMGPPPQTPEQKRQQALRAWLAETDFGKMVDSAPSVLWPDQAHLWQQPAATGGRRAYKALARIIHPDKQPAARAAEASQMFQALDRAFKTSIAA